MITHNTTHTHTNLTLAEMSSHFILHAKHGQPNDDRDYHSRKKQQAHYPNPPPQHPVHKQRENPGSILHVDGMRDGVLHLLEYEHVEDILDERHDGADLGEVIEIGKVFKLLVLILGALTKLRRRVKAQVRGRSGGGQSNPIQSNQEKHSPPRPRTARPPSCCETFGTPSSMCQTISSETTSAYLHREWEIQRK